jgi:hypothetical protein
LGGLLATTGVNVACKVPTGHHPGIEHGIVELSYASV